MKRTLHGMLALIAVFFLSVPTASAQVDRATLSGVVRDTGGGVIPGATVTVTVAPGTTPPPVSRTTPLRVARSTCAERPGTCRNNTAIKASMPCSVRFMNIPPKLTVI